ncbi:WD40-repeat-containing domain protein [Syncephalastrum racemosum]|uniref:WD40-repeat-containing domain protein n=1 Tax=Syncephalastrum racemosum TaxID=13706 RepID=A0A1X2H7E1_SYNRA|nr:WD40-repeat-containing domain protein [Syncephalastrum racemosum]
MKGAARRKVSYVVDTCETQHAHRLGVNSLAIDPNNAVLYSAGRDGVVAGWDLHIQPDSNETSKPPNATSRMFSQLHTDWVNDICLAHNNSCLITASSDRTIKAWHDASEAAHTVGWHTDYVKCLASADGPGWVASAGFDKRINLWNIERCEALLTMGAKQDDEGGHTSSKASIYAMATNPSGSLIATGSPEKVVRLWDPRSGKHIGKLTGHTDNIRALLLSHDGTHILSGSSDSTIKLWSVKAQRCLSTYETHVDSVWALYSDDPELRTFYAGSRDGMVTRTEISGQEEDGESECIGLFKEESGVTKIAVWNDTYVWTATSSSSIHRWLSVPPREARPILKRSHYNTDIPISAVAKLPAPSRPAAHHAHQLQEPYLGSDNLTLYAGSVMSIPISYQDDDIPSAESLLPLRTVPDGVIEGKPGIASHVVLQSRRHVLTQDTNGEVALWDLVNCVRIKEFGKQEIETVVNDMKSMESNPPWCSVDTKIGAITVQLDGFTCFDCEMYADEANLPSTYDVREDQRLNVGKWVLVHLFANFIAAISKRHGLTHVSSEAARPPTSAQRPPLTSITTQANGPYPHQEKVEPPFDASSPSPNIYNGPFTAPPTTQPQPDYFSGAHHMEDDKSQEDGAAMSPTLESPTTPNGNLINRFKHWSVKSNKSPKSPMSDSHPEEEGNVHEEAPAPTKFTPPNVSDYPPLAIPPSTTVILAEESAEASTGMDLYRGTVASLGRDANTVSKIAPSWLLTFLYTSKAPNKETVKLTFALKPHPGSKLPELPGGPNNRLLANRVLRVRKLVQYVAEKLELPPDEVDELELLCGETVLANTMTLASIKQHIMKTGGDVILSYRYKVIKQL